WSSPSARSAPTGSTSWSSPGWWSRSTARARSGPARTRSSASAAATVTWSPRATPSSASPATRSGRTPGAAPRRSATTSSAAGSSSRAPEGRGQLDFLALALPPLRPAAAFWALVPPWLLVSRFFPEPEALPPLLDASGVLAILAARSLLMPFLRRPPYFLSSLTLGPWSLAIVSLLVRPRIVISTGEPEQSQPGGGAGVGDLGVGGHVDQVGDAGVEGPAQGRGQLGGGGDQLAGGAGGLGAQVVAAPGGGV